MARYDSRPSRYEIVAQTYLTTRKLTDLSAQLAIPLRTLKRIVAEPQFKAIFKQLKLELMDDARVKFRNEVDPSFETIREIRDDKFVAPAVRLAAACKLIEYGLDADTVERFEDRLEKLEAKTVEAVAAESWIDSNGSNQDFVYQTDEDRTCAA